MTASLLWLLLGPTPTVGAPPSEADAAWIPDRSQPPAVEPPVRMALAEPARVELGPGRQARLLQVEGVRKVDLRVELGLGRLDLCPDAPVPCQALADQWTLASASRDPSAMEAELDRLEATLYAELGDRRLSLRMQVPAERLDAGLALLEEVLRAPAFSRRELKLRAREERVWIEEEAPTDLRAAAGSALSYAFTASDPAYRVLPDPDAWRRITPGQLEALHARVLAEAPVLVHVTGPLDAAAAQATAERLSEGLGVARETPKNPAFIGITENHYLAVDLPGQPQAALRMRMSAPALGHEEEVRFQSLDFALGGPFMSRINRNLREEKGWTYGAGSWYFRRQEYGTWTVSTDVPSEHASAAIREIEAEIDGVVRKGPTREELDAAWRDEVAWWNRTLEDAGRAGGWSFNLHDDGLSAEEAAARVDALTGLTPARTIATADRWLGPDAPRLWVVAGDRDVLEPQLAELGWEVTWISAEQAIRGSW